jgi:hypothetical protein
MKNRLFNGMLVVMVGLVLATVGALSAAECADVEDVIMIDTEGYAADKKGPVKLTHKKHTEEYGVACTDCHHVFEDGKNVWKEGDPVQKCSECHDYEKSEGNAKKLQLAFHQNCKDCHKESYKAGKKDAPFRKCNDCHE